MYVTKWDANIYAKLNKQIGRARFNGRSNKYFFLVRWTICFEKVNMFL
jgi:hypothetical protein